MNITVFLIDDEAPARRELRYLLEQLPELEIVGEAATATEGLRLLRQLKPRLLFLDIQMPGLTGIELSQILQELPERPLVVFPPPTASLRWMPSILRRLIICSSRSPWSGLARPSTRYASSWLQCRPALKGPCLNRPMTTASG